MVAQKTRVSIIGASGKMGQAIAEALKDHPSLMLYKTFGRETPLDFEQTEVIIDFSAPSAFATYADTAQVPIVVGSTQINDVTLQKMHSIAERLPILYSANMTDGITWIHKVMRTYADWLLEHYAVDILEIHHGQKKDAPSGTALMLKEALHNKPPCLSMRGGDVPGQHTLYLMGDGETIEIRHTAFSKTIFAKGALKAAAWLVKQPPGLYGMGDLLCTPLSSPRMRGSRKNAD